MVITWRTHKTPRGFQFHVYSFGYQVPSQTLKIGNCHTRAKAVSMAKGWTLYFKSQAALKANPQYPTQGDR